jgi:hypothetical protein
MYEAKNEILLVNQNNKYMDILSEMLSAIDNSNLSESEKALERDLAMRAIQGGVVNMDVLRPEVLNSKFYNLWGYLVGYTDTPIVESMQVNLRLANTAGNLLSSVSGQGGTLGLIGSVGAGVLGTSQTCGVFGSLFNTKKCKEKQQAAQTPPLQTFQQPQLLQPAQQTLGQVVQQVPQQIAQQDFSQFRNPNEGGGGIMDMVKKYWWVLAAVAAYFIFFQKKGNSRRR